MASEQDLLKALNSISSTQWKAHGIPILLSNLPPLLESEVPGFRDILGANSLRSYIKRLGSDAGLKLIEHPTHKAKVGIAPAGVEYKFPEDERSGKSDVNGSQPPALRLLNELAKLPQEDLDKVIIPVSVLIKLLK